MSDWHELGLLYAIRDAIKRKPRTPMHWRVRFDVMAKLSAAGEAFDARHPEYCDKSEF